MYKVVIGPRSVGQVYKVLAESTKAAESVRYIAYDIESFFVAITEVSTVAGYLAGYLDNPAHNPRFADIGYALGGNMCGTASPSRLTQFVLRTRY